MWEKDRLAQYSKVRWGRKLHQGQSSSASLQQKLQVLFSREDHRRRSCQDPSKKVKPAQSYLQVQFSTRDHKTRFLLVQFSKEGQEYKRLFQDLCRRESKW